MARLFQECSLLTRACAQGRENKKRGKLEFLSHFSSHKGSSSQSLLVGKRGFFLEFFGPHLLCNFWISVALASDLGDVEWKKLGNSLPPGLFFRV